MKEAWLDKDTVERVAEYARELNEMPVHITGYEILYNMIMELKKEIEELKKENIE